jgi:hypothetical protein
MPRIDADAAVNFDHILRLSLQHLKKVAVRMDKHACYMRRIIPGPCLLQ